MNPFPVIETFEINSLIDSLPAIIYVCDPEPPYRTTYISPAVESLGYSPDEWASQPDIRERVLHEDDRDRVLRETEEARLAGTDNDHEYRIIAADGSVRWVHDRGRFVRDEEGRLVWQGVMIDITRRRRAEEDVRRSQERFRQLVEHAADALLVHDLDGRIIDANQRACDSLGYNRDELLKLSVQDIEVNLGAETFSLMGERLACGEPVTFDGINRRKDGTVFPVEVRLGLFETDGSQFVLAVVRDVTERRLAETALRESEQKYRTILENIQDGYYEVDLRGNLTFFNDALCRLLGYSERELRGMNNRRYTDPESASKVYLAFNKVYRTGEPIKGYAYEVVRKDGTKRYIEASVSLLNDSAGLAVGFRGIIRDVTERRQMEAALWQSEREYRKLFENANDAILIFDPESEIILEANKKAFDLYGLRKEEFIGMSLKLLTRDANQVRQRVREAFESGGSKSFETVHFRKDGTPIEILGSGAVIEYGGRKAVMTIARDVTEIKRLQQQLIQSEKLAALGQLVSGVAHELNNPLTSVLGYTQLLLTRGALDSRSAEQLEIVGNEADRARRIVRNLLSFSRQHKPSRAEVDVNELLERTLELRAYEMKVSNISVRRDLAAIPCVFADEHQLQQVFLNIIINAEQAMQSLAREAALTVRTEMGTDARVKVVIADNGPGISPQIIEKLFDPFFTTKPVGQGTGLGLSISYGIVKEHDGAIRVESEAGRGARFIIELPVKSS